MAGETLSVTLSEEAMALLRRKVESGAYPDESAVLADGLLALADQDARLEAWLREDVGPTWDAVKRDPSRLLTPEEAWAFLADEVTKRSG